MAVGTQGVVSVSSHIIGNEMQSMIKAFIAGNVQEAAEIHRQLLPIMTGLFKAPSPVPVKAALQMRGIERSEEHTSELQSRGQLVCRLLLEKKKFKVSQKKQ